ncbi:hypothetical protein [Thiolapillus sp.]|uniref:hypothetical protein n=2 Tax=Thiolapillus sp. TaxID=2017437 RepID=UPI0025EEABD9|nr:hypothetical protein [Thiolapillus sp.]
MGEQVSGSTEKTAEEKQESATEHTAKPAVPDGRSHSMLYYFIPVLVLLVLLIAALVAGQSVSAKESTLLHLVEGGVPG